MKTTSCMLLFLLSITLSFSQNPRFKYTGPDMPTVKQATLAHARFVTDLTPVLWKKLAIPYNDLLELDQRRKLYYALGYDLYPLGGYEMIVDYVAVGITATCNGKVITAQSNGGILNKDLKAILKNADLGSNLAIKIKYKYKKQANEKSGIDAKVMEGLVNIDIVPETEAEYPGGFGQLSEYLVVNVFDQVDAKSVDNIMNVIVKFTVDEQGQVGAAKLVRTSSDLKLDKLILNAINKMPKWTPAMDLKGIKVKQEFAIPFNRGGGC